MEIFARRDFLMSLCYLLKTRVVGRFGRVITKFG